MNLFEKMNFKFVIIVVNEVFVDCRIIKEVIDEFYFLLVIFISRILFVRWGIY